jgi:hypothetical protein
VRLAFRATALVTSGRNAQGSTEDPLRENSQTEVPVTEPDDEKTPVSTYYSQLHIRIRDDEAPRPAATRLGHLPIRPRLSIRIPKATVAEPSVVIDSADRAELLVESQPDTIFIARRRYARMLELTLVAGISALLAAAVSLWLASIVGGKSSYAADPVKSISLTPPVARDFATE